MKLTIDEAIKDIKLTCEYLKNIGVFDNSANEKCKPSLDMAIDTMHKYQKIEQALNSWNINCINDREFINTIREVIDND